MKLQVKSAFNAVRSMGRKAIASGALIAATTGSAMADTLADVTTVINDQKTLALGVVVVGTVAVLAIRYSKLARRA